MTIDSRVTRWRVFVTGSTGQLGAMILREFAQHDVIAHTHASLEITDDRAIRREVAAARPDVVINCAAFNDVDGAEDRVSEAFAINAFAVRSLARAAEEAGATLVHYSTDFVFAGHDRAEPYTEDDPPAPRSSYAASKLLGEWFALDAPRAFVLRVESLFGSPPGWPGRRGTLDGIVGGLERGDAVRVFTDRVVSPSYTPDIASATHHLLAAGAATGLYHCVNDGRATWYEVAAEAARILGIDPRLQPTTTDQLVLKAPRPRFCALSPARLRAAGFAMPPWQDALRRWLAGRAAPSMHIK